MGAQKYFSSAAAESACRQYRVVREALLPEAGLRQRQRGICPSGGQIRLDRIRLRRFGPLLRLRELDGEVAHDGQFVHYPVAPGYGVAAVKDILQGGGHIVHVVVSIHPAGYGETQ